MKKFFKRTGIIILFLVVIALFINVIPTNDAIALNGFMKKQDQKIIVATQSGGSSKYPNNVIAAFNEGSSHGVMVFSVSVYMTRDEVLIVSDTDELGELTELDSGKISESDYIDIKSLNFAYQFKDENGEYPYRKQALNCVAVEQLFAQFPYSDFIVEINMQSGDNERAAILLCELVRQSGLSTRVVISGSADAVNYVKKETNVTVLTQATDKDLKRFAYLRSIMLSNLYRDLPFQHVNIPIEQIDGYKKSVITALQKRNVSVYISGVETSEQLQKTLEYGCDGIVTKHPELIQSLLNDSDK